MGGSGETWGGQIVIMAIEIVDLPIESLEIVVIFHSCFYVYQRVYDGIEWIIGRSHYMSGRISN